MQQLCPLPSLCRIVYPWLWSVVTPSLRSMESQCAGGSTHGVWLKVRDWRSTDLSPTKRNMSHAHTCKHTSVCSFMGLLSRLYVGMICKAVTQSMCSWFALIAPLIAHTCSYTRKRLRLHNELAQIIERIAFSIYYSLFYVQRWSNALCFPIVSTL